MKNSFCRWWPSTLRTLKPRYSRCDPNLDRGSSYRFRSYFSGQWKIRDAQWPLPFHGTWKHKSRRYVGWNMGFFAGACDPRPYPSSAYCLGCDTNASRVIMSIRFEHYISCGENPCRHSPSNFPLVTQRKGVHATLLRDAEASTLCFAHVVKNAGCIDIGIPFTRRGEVDC